MSAWSAPTVLVTKKDGTTRFCVDYRRLNNNTKKDAFPLPRIDDSLNSLSGQSWFSTLDLASGYWQVRLSEDAKPKTAFATHSGLFQFAVMPFGLCNAPATFERLMSQLMRGLHWKRCLVYIDDILVFGNDFESALHSLELVLTRVAEYGLQLKSTKCNLFRTSVPFLGHIVGRAGLECDPNKVSAVANWIPPSTIKGVREFLGFTGYYRRFVPDYSTVAQPLVRLLGKDCKFKWTDACQDAFKALRAPTNDEDIVQIDTVPDSIVEKDTVPSSTWDLQDAKCILSMKSDCSIDVKGYRFFTMERLFYALQLLSLGDRKLIGQLAKYSRMDYVRKCVNTRFEMASSTLQDKWLDEQFQTWIQIITARILSDPVFKQALLDSAGSPLCDPRGLSVHDSAYISKENVCTTKAADLAILDNTSHACHTWAGACLIGPEIRMHYDTECFEQGCYGNQSLL